MVPILLDAKCILFFIILYDKTFTETMIPIFHRSAMSLCQVGGDIVYSTCTLAAAQNDGVIQRAVEEVSVTKQVGLKKYVFA